MSNLVIMKEQQAVTTSLNVSETFEKNHQHVLRDIRELEKDVSNFGLMFSEGSEPDSYGRPRTVFYMNRKGFVLLVMGYTGKKAFHFKEAYIDAFDEMEQHIKKQIDVSQLSPDLQMFHSIFKSLAEQQMEFTYQKERQQELENKIDGISDLITLETKDWRKEVNGIIRKIAVKQGGFDRFSEVGSESYRTLEEKARCSLNIRLENRQKNMIAQGVGKAAVKRLNKLDIIEEDHRLKEIYISVVKSMAIKYGVYEKEISK